MQDLAEIRGHLAGLNARLAVWDKNVDDEFRKLWNINDTDPARFGESVKEAHDLAVLQVGPGPLEEVYRLFDNLGGIYLEASVEERAQIRDLLGDKPNLLDAAQGYVERAAQLLEQSRDARWLRLGLAAASIEDRRADYRDTLAALSDLYVAAKRAGITPRPYFQAVAEISNPVNEHGYSTTSVRHPSLRRVFQPFAKLQEQLFGNGSTQDLLMNFHKAPFSWQVDIPKPGD
jgi:hypothetical protein